MGGGGKGGGKKGVCAESDNSFFYRLYHSFSAFLAFSNKEEPVMDLVLDGLNMSRVVVIS